MNQINCARVLIGGVVAGVVIFLTMGFANHVCMGPLWKAWMVTPAAAMLGHPNKHSLILWGIGSLILGVTGTSVYAGIRPRYGAGGLTAIRAGLLMWLASYVVGM